MAAFDLNIFSTDDNLHLIPPYIDDPDFLVKGWDDQGLKGHVFICSSGTSSQGEIKTYALSKTALLENAAAVNKLINASSSDKWLCSLPAFHVGGLSIFARSYLCRSQPVILDRKWKDEDALIDIEFFSVVPTQLYRMVQKKLTPPKRHKALFVGGDFLSSGLREQARSLGWNIILTYGMTEVCSQFASSFVTDSFDNYLDILPIHSFEGDLIRSKSLYTSRIIFHGKDYETFVSANMFQLPDKYKLNSNKTKIKPLGRGDGHFKHKGKLYHKFQVLDLIQNILLELNALENCQVVLEKNEELGEVPVLLVTKEKLKTALENKILASNYLKGLDFYFRIVEHIDSYGVGKIKNF